jgi:hypothetical protein
MANELLLLSRKSWRAHVNIIVAALLLIKWRWYCKCCFSGEVIELVQNEREQKWLLINARYSGRPVSIAYGVRTAACTFCCCAAVIKHARQNIIRNGRKWSGVSGEVIFNCILSRPRSQARNWSECANFLEASVCIGYMYSRRDWHVAYWWMRHSASSKYCWRKGWNSLVCSPIRRQAHCLILKNFGLRMSQYIYYIGSKCIFNHISVFSRSLRKCIFNDRNEYPIWLICAEIK